MGTQDGYASRPAPMLGTLEKAEASLRSNSYLALKNVSCELDQGVLTLRGCVPSYYLREMAHETVERLDGVRSVVNEIEVISTCRR
jgi:osmotically-inducible protein OsmY